MPFLKNWSIHYPFIPGQPAWASLLKFWWHHETWRVYVALCNFSYLKTNISPSKAFLIIFEEDFPCPQVWYISSLEGNHFEFIYVFPIYIYIITVRTSERRYRFRMFYCRCFTIWTDMDFALSAPFAPGITAKAAECVRGLSSIMQFSLWWRVCWQKLPYELLFEISGWLHSVLDVIGEIYGFRIFVIVFALTWQWYVDHYWSIPSWILLKRKTNGPTFNIIGRAKKGGKSLNSEFMIR